MIFFLKMYTHNTATYFHAVVYVVWCFAFILFNCLFVPRSVFAQVPLRDSDFLHTAVSYSSLRKTYNNDAKFCCPNLISENLKSGHNSRRESHSFQQQVTAHLPKFWSWKWESINTGSFWKPLLDLNSQSVYFKYRKRCDGTRVPVSQQGILVSDRPKLWAALISNAWTGPHDLSLHPSINVCRMRASINKLRNYKLLQWGKIGNV